MVKFEELEIWDYIPGYNNYKVSSKGRVFSIKSNKLLQLSKDIHGYYNVGLWKNNQRKLCRIHRLVAMTFYFIEDYAGKQVDHIDRDRTNNNLLNLRFCSNSENQINVGLKKNNTSGYKGVSWDKRTNKWVVKIQGNNMRKHVGQFTTKEAAYEAYKKASKDLHGDFSYAP